jgi:hypothetical protein
MYDGCVQRVNFQVKIDQYLFLTVVVVFNVASILPNQAHQPKSKTHANITSVSTSTHLLQQSISLTKRFPNQIIMSQNHRHPRMSLQIITLRFIIQLIHTGQQFIDVIFQGIQSVLKVMIVVLLFGALVVGYAGLVEGVGGVGVVVLEEFVEEDIPYFGGYFSCFSLE